ESLGSRWRMGRRVFQTREPSGQRLRHGRDGREQEEAVFREVVSFTRDPLPARYYDKDTTKPISFYLPSLEELLAWTPDAEDSFNVALEPLKCRQPPLSSQRPRTLLCHDMMGGYLDDKFIQGSAAQNPYCFYHWQCIDIFVYFSHHLVTIPPVGWTNAAHRHGVCVLGTFIAEWKEGGRLCEAFLAGDERSYQAVADQLVLIAQFFRFDGWLINIESSLSLAAVGNVPPFLRYLSTQLCRQVPGGLVLWYDSVVSSGQSLELIRKHGFSAALFAPGWVYECLEKRDFFQNQDKFWGLLGRYLPPHSICSLPFVTSFCLGMGTRRVCYGQEEAVGPWYHPSAQEIQPLFAEQRPEGDGQGWVKTHCCLADAWNGGSSLLLRGVIPPEVGHVAVRLFSLHVPVPPKIFFSMVYKLEGPSDVGVALELTAGDAGSCHVGGISTLSAETSSRHSPRPLRVPPTKLARWVGHCGQQLSGGWCLLFLLRLRQGMATWWGAPEEPQNRRGSGGPVTQTQERCWEPSRSCLTAGVSPPPQGPLWDGSPFPTWLGASERPAWRALS
uniref:Endo-beta-N-acetylglucosaminidase n=1 Tax=Panthera tigris altaica TaxID=74533 RepID=A0A8C9JFA1_PANTA